MRAVGFKEFGDPEVLEVMDIPEVSAGPGEIRIKNYASAVNPTDIVSRSGLISQFRKDCPLPSVPGMDISGIVDQVGEGVEIASNKTVMVAYVSQTRATRSAAAEEKAAQ